MVVEMQRTLETRRHHGENAGLERWSGVPSILEIQCQLAFLGQIPRSDVGSHRWIEPPDAACFFRSLGIAGSECVVKASNATAMAAFRDALQQHFREHGTPVMVDDRVMAYCIVGASRCSHRGDQVLRFDPHAHGISVSRGARWLTLKKAFGSREWLVFFPHSPTPVGQKRAVGCRSGIA